jgi:hypothetical protein
VELASQLAIDAQTEVADVEVLYRLVKRAYKELRDGGWKPSVSAFLDPNHRISVYRAALCGNDPSSLPANEPGYVCRLITEQVRGIVITRDDPESGNLEAYKVCVKATPQHHEAHADIYIDRSAPTNNAKKKIFRRLKEELAEIAEWESGFAPSDEG